MARILFADDHALLRDTLAAWLRARGHEVTCCDSLAQALAASPPDLVMLDLRLGDLVLPEGIAGLRTRFGDIPLLIMAGAHAPEVAERALAAGADSVLGKALPPAEIQDCILRLTRQRPRPDLSSREIEVLSALASGQSNKEIARDLGLQEVTVKLHMQRLSRKLGARNRTHAALIGRDMGLV